MTMPELKKRPQHACILLLRHTHENTEREGRGVERRVMLHWIAQ